MKPVGWLQGFGKVVLTAGTGFVVVKTGNLNP